MPEASNRSRPSIRTCVGCRNRAPLTELLRFALDENGALSVDSGGAAQGRGAWMCPNPSCLQQAMKRNAFSRSFRRRVSYDPVSLPGEVSQGLSFRVEAAMRSARRAGVLTKKITRERDGAPRGGPSTERADITSDRSIHEDQRYLTWGDPRSEWVIHNAVWAKRLAEANRTLHTWNNRVGAIAFEATHRGRRKRGS